MDDIKPKRKKWRSRRSFDVSDDIRICQYWGSCGMIQSTEAFVMGFSQTMYDRRRAELEASGALAAYQKAYDSELRFMVLAGHMTESEARQHDDADEIQSDD